KDNLITAPVGTTLEQAERMFHNNRVEKLPVVDDDGILRGLITIKDIEKKIKYPLATKDEQGRLRAGAAVGVGPSGEERADALIERGVDVIVVDTAHGHNAGIRETVRNIKAKHDVAVIAGNIATGAAAADLIDVGADALKVGIGPGTI